MQTFRTYPKQPITLMQHCCIDAISVVLMWECWVAPLRQCYCTRERQQGNQTLLPRESFWEEGGQGVVVTGWEWTESGRVSRCADPGKGQARIWLLGRIQGPVRKPCGPIFNCVASSILNSRHRSKESHRVAGASPGARRWKCLCPRRRIWHRPACLVSLA